MTAADLGLLAGIAGGADFDAFGKGVGMVIHLE